MPGTRVTSILIAALIALIPPLIALFVWFSPLAFVPVPWPDDSAFYFVAKDLFSWPPRWVMIPQAPFEPTYRIFNFNTMPLYPILIGLGRSVGIDGSFGLKFWPLTAWAASGSLLVVVLYRMGLPALGAALIALVLSLDPVLRWASVLIRPESLIGLFGMTLVLGLTFGFPTWLRKSWLWDPIAALLALSAYAHFNAIHLIFPVVFAFWRDPRRLLEIGARAALYLSPWVLAALWHWQIFVQQMTTQWTRLAVPNDWLTSINKALAGLFQSLGSPDPWPTVLIIAAIGFWVLIFAAIIVLAIATPKYSKSGNTLLPSAAWVLGALWLWHTKPEVWFVYYLHLSIWCFVGVAAFLMWKSSVPLLRSGALTVLGLLVVTITVIFGYVDISQASRLGSSSSWRWGTYQKYIDCIDTRLTKLETDLTTNGKHFTRESPFRVWGPTFPDVLVELSRRHPDWEFTRTNDFWERSALAIRHGHEVEAVVVTETINWAERTLSAPMNEHPEVTSLWMTWKTHFLNQLWTDPSWKPNRYLCQLGRWQAFMFMKGHQ